MSVIILLFPAIAISVLYTRAQSSVIDFYSGWPWASRSLSLSLSEAAGLIRPVTVIAGRQQTRCRLERTKHWRDRCFTLQFEEQEAAQIHL